MSKIEKITATILTISGIFFFKILNMERFFPAQEGFYIFCSWLLLSYLVYTKNKLIGLLSLLYAFTFFRTYMSGYVSIARIFNISIFAICSFIVYYFARHFKLKENILKFLLIPAFLNIVLVIIQAFDHKAIPLLPVDGVTGFLGNSSITGYYLAMLSPLFFKYCPKILPLLFIALLLCKSFFGILAFLIITLIYVYYKYRKHFIKAAVISLMLILIYSSFNYKKISEPTRYRLCLYATTLDGIKHNPILGWGLGSYELITDRIKPGDFVYFGYSFNTNAALAKNPHNEFLFGWWNLGILFPILYILITIDIIKKFSIDKIYLFMIIFAGFICMQGCFLNFPLLLFFIVSLAMYENKTEEALND